MSDLLTQANAAVGVRRIANEQYEIERAAIKRGDFIDYDVSEKQFGSSAAARAAGWLPAQEHAGFYRTRE